MKSLRLDKLQINKQQSGRSLAKIFPYFFLFTAAVFFCWLFTGRNGVFGGKVDWISQHSVLPDYFRQQFYETRNFFPEFAPALGGGQNIFHFAYYGLYSPVILPSYLLPFIKMSDYIMAMQFLCLVSSVLLFYHWLKRQGFSAPVCTGTALMFLLAGPMIFHSYNQIMFVNYMPFLCTGFLGVDRYFSAAYGKTRKSGLLTLSIFLMIMTSFYFSIGGILVLVLYGIHKYFKTEYEGTCLFSANTIKRAKQFAKFLAEGIRFLLPVGTAVLMSGILLVPTAFALSGRAPAGENVNASISSLLIPQFSFDRLFYHPYGIGLTVFAGIALISMLFFRKFYEKVLAAECLIVLAVPVFTYMLNGGLYIRGKVLIPFLPLLCYVTAYFLNALKKNTAYICLLLVPSLAALTISDFFMHECADRNITRDFYEEITDESFGKIISQTLEAEEGFFRLEQLGTTDENAANLNRIHADGQYISSLYSSSYNEEYQQFREETFGLEEPFRNFLMQPSVHNPLFQRFMGVKYILSKTDVPGYQPLESQHGDINKNGWRLYANENVAPIAYATDRIIPQVVYETLDFPYNQLALLSYAVTEKETINTDIATGKELKQMLPLQSIDLDLPKEINEKENKSIQAALPEHEGNLLFLQFHVKNKTPSRDLTVWAEGIRNKLTCETHFYYNANTIFTYAIPLQEGQRTLHLTFGKGYYEISEVRCFLGTLPDTKDRMLYQSEFQVDKVHTKGNVIEGEIDAKEDGFFITTIPYDKNFEIHIDNKITSPEKVNTAFLGFRITKGAHKIRIIYHAPGAAAGKWISAAGFLLLLVYFSCSRKRNFYLKSPIAALPDICSPAMYSRHLLHNQKPQAVPLFGSIFITHHIMGLAVQPLYFLIRSSGSVIRNSNCRPLISCPSILYLN